MATTLQGLATWTCVAMLGGCAVSAPEQTEVQSDTSEEWPGGHACSSSDVPSTMPAGNLLLVRDAEGEALETTSIACSTMGIASVHDDNTALEVAVDAPLVEFAGGAGVTCEECLAFQGGGGIEPRRSGSWSLRKLSLPAIIVSIGTKGQLPAPAYYFGNSTVAGVANISSYCLEASPQFGRLTNSHGWERVLTEYGTAAYGSYAYQMWDAATLTTRGASVNAQGILSNIPISDACK